MDFVCNFADKDEIAYKRNGKKKERVAAVGADKDNRSGCRG